MTGDAPKVVVSEDLARSTFTDTLDDGRLVVSVEALGDGDDEGRKAEAKRLLRARPGAIVIVPPSHASWFAMRVSPDLPPVPPGTDPGSSNADPDTGVVLVPPGTFGKHFGHDVVERGSHPSGFALRVVQTPDDPDHAVDMDAGWILAEPVALSDVFTDVVLDGGEVTQQAGAVHLADLSYDLGGKELYREGDTALRVRAGKLESHPEANVALTMRSRRIDSLGFAVRGGLDADLEVELVTSGAWKKDFSTTLYESYHTLPTQMIGPVPLIETVRIQVIATCSVSADAQLSLSAGVTVHAPLTVGAHYTSASGWVNLSDIGVPEFTPVSPELRVDSRAALTCSVAPVFNLFFYNVIGPALSGTASTMLSVASAPSARDALLAWSLDGELSARLGLDVNTKLPGFSRLSSVAESGLATTEMTLFDERRTLAHDTLPGSPHSGSH